MEGPSQLHCIISLVVEYIKSKEWRLNSNHSTVSKQCKPIEVFSIIFYVKNLWSSKAEMDQDYLETEQTEIGWAHDKVGQGLDVC